MAAIDLGAFEHWQDASTPPLSFINDEGNGLERWKDAGSTEAPYVFNVPGSTDWTATYTETINVTDSFIRNVTKMFSETVNITDTIITLKIIAREWTETINVSDSFIRTVEKVWSETVNVSDSLIRTLSRTFTETVNITDSMVRTITKVFTETVNVTAGIVMYLNGITAGIWSKTARRASSFLKRARPGKNWRKTPRP